MAMLSAHCVLPRHVIVQSQRSFSIVSTTPNTSHAQINLVLGTYAHNKFTILTHSRNAKIWKYSCSLGA
ncbi:unnamed protein product [Periconia digitata]|uniref:Uncharacterized protein n=1 Tax=Periconia digitata TaxID=1303443 RepID=A0A9W4U6V4_9PLEO|nr:unnamed protein product [Periconia digitata]